MIIAICKKKKRKIWKEKMKLIFFKKKKVILAPFFFSFFFEKNNIYLILFIIIKWILINVDLFIFFIFLKNKKMQMRAILIRLCVAASCAGGASAVPLAPTPCDVGCQRDDVCVAGRNASALLSEAACYASGERRCGAGNVCNTFGSEFCFFFLFLFFVESRKHCFWAFVHSKVFFLLANVCRSTPLATHVARCLTTTAR